MTKSKKNKKMKGGDGAIPSSNSIMNWFSNTWNNTKKSSQGLLNKIQQTTSSLIPSNTSTSTPYSNTTTSTPYSNTTSSSTPFSTSMTQNPNVQPSLNTYSSKGGKKSRTRRARKRGGGAMPVHGLNVAKPTYYLTGGKSKKRKNKLNKKKIMFLFSTSCNILCIFLKRLNLQNSFEQ